MHTWPTQICGHHRVVTYGGNRACFTLFVHWYNKVHKVKLEGLELQYFSLMQLHVWPAEGDLCWEVPVLALRSYQTRRTDFNDFVSRRFHRRSQETGAFPGAVIHTHSLVHAVIKLFMFTNTHSNLHWLYRWIKFFYSSWHNKIQERQPRTQIGCKLPHWWSLTEVSPVCVSCLSSTRQCALLYHSVKC